MAHKKSSDNLSAMASSVLGRKARKTVTAKEYNELLAIAKSLAGSVLSQDEDKGARKAAPPKTSGDGPDPTRAFVYIS